VTEPRQDVVAVIPAYQCAVTVGEVVAGVSPYVSRVIVVDDGATDGSGAVAAAAGAEVIRNPVNRGKGHALRRAFDAVIAERRAARGRGEEPRVEAVAMLDGDGQHDPADLPVLLAAWDGREYGLVVGGRLKERALIPPHRYWTNTIGTKLLSWVTGVALEDSQSGYRVISADLLERMNLRSDGYAIESEMLIKAARRGARIGQVVIKTIYHDRVPSFYRPVRDTVAITCASAYHRLFDRA
jgi:glycosyltransferase involved in cell wall biosynthesis